MIISSLILKCFVGMEEQLRELLTNLEGLAIEKVLKGELILTLESPTVERAMEVMDKEILKLEGVLGVYPVYIHFETA